MAQVSMPQIDALRETLVEPARDMKANLGAIAASEYLDAEQIWGTCLACAYYLGEARLRDALLVDARAAGVAPTVIEDAQAAAVIMGMNTVYYRFRHLVGKESYAKKPARLRMQWISKPRTSKATYELMSLGIAALAGCEVCIKAHEDSILASGLSEEHVHEVARLAAILQGAAVALHIA
jgi:alkyl hydroperoxide reductase subunit D